MAELEVQWNSNLMTSKYCPIKLIKNMLSHLSCLKTFPYMKIIFSVNFNMEERGEPLIYESDGIMDIDSPVQE